MINLINVSLDVSKLLAETTGAIEQFKLNKRYDENAYKELLDAYSSLVGKLTHIESELKSKQMPSKEEVDTISQMAHLMGLKNEDGTLDIDKIMKFADQNDKSLGEG